MSKLIRKFNEQTSTDWQDDPQYNELFFCTRIKYLEALIKVEGLITLKEALRYFGFDTRGYDIPTLTRYWADGEIDITYNKIGDNEYEITFETDD